MKTITIEAAGLAFSQDGERIRIDQTRADGVTWIGLDEAHYEKLMRLFHKTHATQRPPEHPRVVCLCGSTRFAQTFHEANLRETLAGHIVLSIGCDLKSDTDLLLAGEITTEDKMRLDELHLRKIDLADEILVLNVGGYLGESTCREIAYADLHGKRIRWWEPPRVQTAAQYTDAHLVGLHCSEEYYHAHHL